VLKARPVRTGRQAPYAPPPIDEVVAAIRDQRPAVVFAPHVETASGMMLPDDYLRAVADAVHAVDGLFVLDCIASGAMWVDMEATGVDVLISAPQKGWSSSPCAALVMLSQRARTAIDGTTSTSFACDLRKWLSIMEAYERAVMPITARCRRTRLPSCATRCATTERFGFERAREAQMELGAKVRALFASHGIASVAAPGFEAPGVVVSYTDDPGITRAPSSSREGLQTARGVPLQCDEPADFKTFRVGCSASTSSPTSLAQRAISSAR
jgi:aspartate aminotransferase-like enzyme